MTGADLTDAGAAGSSATATGTAVTGPTLTVEHLDVTYRVRGQDRRALHDVSFEIARGESFGLVGESGSGKSTAALALTRYLPRNGRVSAGAISISGMNPLAMGPGALRDLRARTVSMVYQEPGRALNPSIKVGRQVAEVYEIAGLSRPEAMQRAQAMLAKVQIADPARVMERYPHQLSGGMAQRAVVAMALAAEPSLLILDEPTTSLDATVEAEVLDLVASLRQELATSVLFISHNLAVIAKMCDRVGVLYAGELVEEGPAAEVLRQPRHPYTMGLLRCIPRAGQRKDHGRLDSIPGFLPPPGAALPGCIFAPRCPIAEDRCRAAPPPPFAVSTRVDTVRPGAAQPRGIPPDRHDPDPDGPDKPASVPGRTSRCYRHEITPSLPRNTPADLDLPSERDASLPVVEMARLSKTFRSGGEAVQALAGVDLTLSAGETLGLVGESGSGKTTLARALLGLIAPDRGSVISLDGRPLHGDTRRRSPAELKALQIVFQNPDSALNRRHTVRRLISQPLARLAGLSGGRLAERMADLVRSVRMEDRHLQLRPGQLSGGLKQRVAIARAFAGGPRIVVCDEPTSALDVSVQAAILNLLVDLQAKEKVSYLFISHDLGLVRYLSDRIAVLYLGRLMEVGPAEAVFEGPHHPYTEALLSAVLVLDDAAGGAAGPDGPRAEVPGPSSSVRTRAGQTSEGRIRLQGEIPSAAHPPSGCVFHTRCPRKLADGSCESSVPSLREVAPGHFMSCHIPIDQLAVLQRSEGGTQ